MRVTVRSPIGIPQIRSQFGRTVEAAGKAVNIRGLAIVVEVSGNAATDWNALPGISFEP
jgi:hypothetical protein